MQADTNTYPVGAMTEKKKKPPLSKEEIEELREELKLTDTLTRIENTIVVLSGKGGVGKSSVAVNLAAGLAANDRQVGLLDIDIHGPSIPTLLGLEGKGLPPATGAGMSPIEYSETLKVMSVEFIAGERAGEAVIWRGPMKHRVIQQFLSEVDWGQLDFLVVDAPPGTGDEPLSVCQLAPPRAKAVIVTTPQDLSVKDVRKSIRFCAAVNMPVFGIVENMSGFVCPDCGARHDLFKSGGGQRLAAELGIRFLGKIPIDPRLVGASDAGKPFVTEYPASPAVQAFDRIIREVLNLSAPRMKKH